VPGQGLIYGDGKLGRVCSVNQSARRQPWNFRNVAVIKSMADSQHGLDPFQKYWSLFRRDIGGKYHQGLKLSIGKRERHGAEILSQQDSPFNYI
jgi:hypothetical protein